MISKPVLLLGDANFDIVIRLPESDSESDALKDLLPQPYAGGTAGNTAAALAHLGIDVALACAVGDDGHGRFILRGLSDVGVDMRLAHVTREQHTLTVTVIIDRGGQRYFARFPASEHASSYYPAGKLDRRLFSEIGWLHSSGSTFDHGSTADAVIRAMTLAREANVPISFDLNLRPQGDALREGELTMIRRAVELSDFVLGSAKDEIVWLTGIADLDRASSALSAGVRNIIARVGSEGAIVTMASGEVTHVPAFQTEVVDTLGAGDLFDAGFIAGMISGQAVVASARWGNALASLSISREGAAGHITREGLESLLGSENTPVS